MKTLNQLDYLSARMDSSVQLFTDLMRAHRYDTDKLQWCGVKSAVSHENGTVEIDYTDNTLVTYSNHMEAMVAILKRKETPEVVFNEAEYPEELRVVVYDKTQTSGVDTPIDIGFITCVNPEEVTYRFFSGKAVKGGLYKRFRELLDHSDNYAAGVEELKDGIREAVKALHDQFYIHPDAVLDWNNV